MYEIFSKKGNDKEKLQQNKGKKLDFPGQKLKN
jgi:hypothetical protein